MILGGDALHPDLHQSECEHAHKRGYGDFEKVPHQRTEGQSSVVDLLVCLRLRMRALGTMARRVGEVAYPAAESVLGEYVGDTVCAGAEL